MEEGAILLDVVDIILFPFSILDDLVCTDHPSSHLSASQDDLMPEATQRSYIASQSTQISTPTAWAHPLVDYNSLGTITISDFPFRRTYSDRYKRVARHVQNEHYQSHSAAHSVSRVQSIELIRLVQFLQQRSQSPFRVIKAELRASSSVHLERFHIATVIDTALISVVRLWLFATIALQGENETLGAALAISLPQRGVLRKESLSFDFSATNLTRKGGFKFVWTSDLSNHLTFASHSEIYFFRHGRLLEYLSRSQYK